MLNIKSYFTAFGVISLILVGAFIGYKLYSLNKEVHELRLKNQELEFINYNSKESIARLNKMLDKQNENISAMNKELNEKLKSYNLWRGLGDKRYDDILNPIREKNSLEEKLGIISGMNLKDL